MTAIAKQQQTRSIADRCAAIRKSWSPVERRQRRVLACAAQQSLASLVGGQRRLLASA